MKSLSSVRNEKIKESKEEKLTHEDVELDEMAEPEHVDGAENINQDVANKSIIRNGTSSDAVRKKRLTNLKSSLFSKKLILKIRNSVNKTK